MSLYPCSACSERVPGKMSQVYWAWLRADDTRVAYKQRLCSACFITNVWIAASEAMNNLVACPVCHEGTADNMDPVYATLYVPGQPRMDAEMALCPRDAVEIRNRALLGAESLQDRQSALGGSSPPPPTAADTWAALGITPRALNADGR